MSAYYPPMKAATHHGRGFVEITRNAELVCRVPLTELKLAKIMAAGPALLLALEDLVKEYDKEESVHLPWRAARTAIKEATTTT
jgi:hypothetical protein